MKNTVFIHTNNKQRLGALVAKHAIVSCLHDPDSTEVRFINVDELKVFKNFIGATYLFSKNEKRTYTKDDLQSFTLSRFMASELMGYSGKAVVIDPDIFALCDIAELFKVDMEGAAVLACRKKDAWDTSVMLMDCSKLLHWNITTILSGLRNHTLTYTDIMTLRNEAGAIREISRIWNSLDEYTGETKIIHMTGRLTQPWKTGLPIDFTRNKMKKIFGVIPREPILKILGKYPSRYMAHPDKSVEDLFFKLAKNAMVAGAVTEELIQKEMEAGHVRPDFLNRVSRI
jgi:hypothetical protein